jgi:hypothetical protein
LEDGDWWDDALVPTTREAEPTEPWLLAELTDALDPPE